MATSINLLILITTILCSCIPHHSLGELSAYQQLDALRTQARRSTLSTHSSFRQNDAPVNEAASMRTCSGFMPNAHCPHTCNPNFEVAGSEDCSACSLYRFMPPAECSECTPETPCNSCSMHKFMPGNECIVRLPYAAGSAMPTEKPSGTTTSPTPLIPSGTSAPGTVKPGESPPPSPAPNGPEKPSGTEKTPGTEKPPIPEQPSAPSGRPSEKANAVPGAVAASTTGMSAAAIAGIVIGCVALVAVVAFVAFKKKKKKANEEEMFTDPNDLETAPTESASYAAM